MRFPEFSGEWSKYKVSDFLEFFPTNSLSWDQLEYSGNEPLNLHYGLIHNGLPVQIEVSRDALPSIKEESFPKKFTFCKDGDIAFADASEDTNDVGKAVEFYNCAGKKIVCGLHTIHGRDKLELTSIGFKGYLFSSKVYHDQIKSIAQGTKVFSIKTSNFDEVILGLPEKEEQGKISRLMMAIDERISTQSKIIEELKTLRSSLRQKLLYKNDVVMRPLSDFSELKNGYAFKSWPSGTRTICSAVTTTLHRGQPWSTPCLPPARHTALMNGRGLRMSCAGSRNTNRQGKTTQTFFPETGAHCLQSNSNQYHTPIKRLQPTSH